MARLLVVHDDRADVQVEVKPTDEGSWQARCPCEWTTEEDFGAQSSVALRRVIFAAWAHVDQTHRSLR